MIIITEGMIQVNNFKVSILTVLLFISIFPGLSMSANYEYGNTPGNSLNGSWVVKKDNWIYFTDMHNKIQKIPFNGGQKICIDRNSSIEKIFIVNRWIYFANEITELGGEPGIFRMSIDGKIKEQVADKDCELVYIMNNYLFYYKTNKDLYFYRRNLDDGTEILIEKTQVRDCCAVGGNIYYFSRFKFNESQV